MRLLELLTWGCVTALWSLEERERERKHKWRQIEKQFSPISPNFLPQQRGPKKAELFFRDTLSGHGVLIHSQNIINICECQGVQPAVQKALPTLSKCLTWSVSSVSILLRTPCCFGCRPHTL